MKKIYFLFLMLVIPLLVFGSALAEEPAYYYYEQPFKVNPIYADIFTAEELKENWTRESSVPKGSSETATSKQEIVEQLKTGLKNFEPTIEISFNTPELYTMADLFDDARAHTGVPNEGDYINYNYSGYSGSSSYYTYSDHFEGTFTYNFTYLHSQQQEIEAAAAFQETFNAIQPADGSDYAKALAVYDYLIENLEYDYEHLNDDSYKLKHSAYSAVVQHITVCQGYASMMYRLLLMFDVNNRIASSQTHAWNLVSVNGDWYQTDATWGDTGQDHDGYFLKSKTAFADSDHVIITTGRADPSFTEYELLSLSDYSEKPLTKSISITDSTGAKINNSTLTIHNKTGRFNASASPADAGQDLRWESSNTKTADVDSTGLVTFVKTGKVRITVSARDKSGISAYFDLNYIPLVSSVTIRDKGGNAVNGKTVSFIENTYQLSAAVLPSDAAQGLRWTSNNTSVAGVDSTGKVSFSSTGTVKITAAATDGSGKSAWVNLNRVPAVTSITIKDASGASVNGKTISTIQNSLQFSATASPAGALQKFTWSSGSTDVATVDASGKVTFKKAGTVKITVKATDGSNKSAWFNLTLLPKATSVTIKDASGASVNGKTITTIQNSLQFSASASPANALQKFTWSSGSTDVATVDASGKVSFKKAGTVKITVKATDGSNKSAWFNLTLLPKATSIKIKDKDGKSLNGKTFKYAKNTYQLTASATPANAYQKFTWSSSNTSVATVTANGKVTFKKLGTVKITAKAQDGSGKSATFTFSRVKPATKITIKNKQGNVVNGKTITITSKTFVLKAAAAPAKASQKFTWISANTSIATVNANGKVTFKKAGTVKITVKATDGTGKTAYVKLRYKP